MYTLTPRKVLLEWKFILLLMILFSSIAFVISFSLPVKYQSSISIIVIQKQIDDKIDAFSAAKSAEYLSNILSTAIYTETFLDGVLSDSPYDVNLNLSQDSEERKEQWKNIVKVHRVNNTGIIDIHVRDISRIQVEKTAQAIAWNLSENGHKYHGGGDRVEIKLIDGPITPQLPVFPNIPMNIAFALLIAFFFSLVFIYFFDEKDVYTGHIDMRDTQNDNKDESVSKPVYDINHEELFHRKTYNTDSSEK